MCSWYIHTVNPKHSLAVCSNQHVKDHHAKIATDKGHFTKEFAVPGLEHQCPGENTILAGGCQAITH